MLPRMILLMKKESKVILVLVGVDVKLDNGRVLTFYTTHLSYSHKFEETHERLEEFENLFDVLKTKKSDFVFYGDLNLSSTSKGVKKLSKIFNNAGPSFEKKTWTTKPFSYNHFVEKYLNWRLDYVFASKDIKIINSEILKTEYSDHLPIQVIIR